MSGKQLDNVQKETHVVSVMMHSLLETLANLRGEKDDRLSPAPNSKANIDRRRKFSLPSDRKDESSVDPRSKIRYRGETAPIRHVVTGILPCARTAELKLDANIATNAILETLSLKRAQFEFEERRCEGMRCSFEGIDTNELHISGSSSYGKIPTEHLAPHENSGKNEVTSQGIFQQA